MPDKFNKGEVLITIEFYQAKPRRCPHEAVFQGGLYSVYYFQPEAVYTSGGYRRAFINKASYTISENF